jgi:hypothetical protein
MEVLTCCEKQHAKQHACTSIIHRVKTASDGKRPTYLVGTTHRVCCCFSEHPVLVVEGGRVHSAEQHEDGENGGTIVSMPSVPRFCASLTLTHPSLTSSCCGFCYPHTSPPLSPLPPYTRVDHSHRPSRACPWRLPWHSAFPSPSAAHCSVWAFSEGGTLLASSNLSIVVESAACLLLAACSVPDVARSR